MLRVTSLIENQSHSEELYAEHGLSLYIEKDDQHYLVDTGETSRFMANALKMGIDLKKLDGVIITHNHSDHIGGLESLLEYNKDVKVYIKSAARSEFYYKKLFFKKYIGGAKELFSKYADRFIFVDDELRIAQDMILLSNTQMDKEYFCKDASLLEKKQGLLVPDNFQHELFLVIEQEQNVVIISSCSHNGVVNIVNTVKDKYRDKEISHIIGGFHMMGFGIRANNCSDDYIKEVAEILDQSCKGVVHTCHCTGKPAYDIMRKHVGDKISYFDTGSKIVLR